MAEELPSYASKVISVRPLTDDYLEILLEIPAGFTWEAGQYMRLGLLCEPTGGWSHPLGYPDPSARRTLFV